MGIKVDKYFNEDCSPKKCTWCHSSYIKSKTVSIDGGVASEIEYRCGDCDTLIGYWAYGHFDPGFKMDYLGVEY